MAEKQIKRILFAEKSLEMAESYKTLFELLIHEGGSDFLQLSYDYVITPCDFRLALDEIKKDYDCLVTDLRLDEKGTPVSVGPNNIPKGVYLADLAREYNPSLLLILNTEADYHVRIIEGVRFDKVFSTSDDKIEEILRYIDGELSKNA